MKTLDRILIIVGVSIAVFTVTMIVTFYVCGSIPDTLCTCFYSAFGGECGVMGLIQIIKEKYGRKKKDGEHNGDQ